MYEEKYDALRREIGALCRAARIESGLSLREVCKLFGIPDGKMYALLKFERKGTPLEWLFKYVKLDPSTVIRGASIILKAREMD